MTKQSCCKSLSNRFARLLIITFPCTKRNLFEKIKHKRFLLSYLNVCLRVIRKPYTKQNKTN